MKILVTGGTGVIGAAAIPALLNTGHRVRLLSRHAEENVARLPAGVEAFNGDVSRPAGLRAAVNGCDAIIHVAGIVEEQPPEVTFERVNVEGTRALCAAAEAEGRPFFIFISSLGAERGQSDYHDSKRRAEAHVRAYAGDGLILRPGGVYGPGDTTVSMLLKMVRSLPAVPMVGAGDQLFQPLWFADLGEALAQAVTRRDLAGRTLELAGPDVTTTNEVLDQLAVITGRNPSRLPIPAWLAQVGASANQALDGAGARLMRAAGLEVPLNPATLQMLLDGNVIPHAENNALFNVFSVKPTPLAEGLEQLADLMPEQPPGEGVGAIERTTYSAEIEGCACSANELIDLVCERITEVMPIEFAAEPGAPHAAKEGATLTGAIPGRGHIQVRMIERTETSATFVTIEGHPLAGVLTFAAEPLDHGVRFSVEVAAQPADVLDWIAMRTAGGAMQSQNWRAVVRRVVELSGGTARAGVKRQSEKLSDAATRRLQERVEAMIARHHRTETERSAR